MFSPLLVLKANSDLLVDDGIFVPSPKIRTVILAIGEKTNGFILVHIDHADVVFELGVIFEIHADIAALNLLFQGDSLPEKTYRSEEIPPEQNGRLRMGTNSHHN